METNLAEPKYNQLHQNATPLKKKMFLWLPFCLGFRCRADSRLAPSQWETALQSNTVSHWLGANLEICSSTFGVELIFDVNLHECRVRCAHVAEARGWIVISSSAIQYSCDKNTYSFAPGWDLIDAAPQYQGAVFVFNSSEELARDSSSAGNV